MKTQTVTYVRSLFVRFRSILLYRDRGYSPFKVVLVMRRMNRQRMSLEVIRACETDTWPSDHIACKIYRLEMGILDILVRLSESFFQRASGKTIKARDAGVSRNGR